MVDTRKKGKAQQTKKAKTASKHKPPVKPTAAAPPTINKCFLTTPARDRFKEIRGFRVTQGRAFLLPKLLANLNLNRCSLLKVGMGMAAIMDGSSINVGEFIAKNIADFAASNKKLSLTLASSTGFVRKPNVTFL